MEELEPKYVDLSLGGNYYCLVWLGKITKGNDTDILNIELKFKDIGKSIPIDLHKLHSFTAENTIFRNINIKHLLDFTIGSIWKDNKLYKKSSILNLGLKFTLSTTKNLIPGKCEDLFKSDPLKNFMYLHFNKGKFILVPSQGFTIQGSSEHIDFLLIPCVEIARFYYSTSGRMIENIVTGLIGDGDSYIKSQSINNDGHIKVKLGPQLGETDALLCGLLLYNEYATSAARHTSAKYLTDFKNSEPSNKQGGRYIEAKIPFENNVKLSVAGKYIRTESAKKVFLVYEITRHHSPCPFLSIGYWPFHDNSQVPESNPKIVPGRNIKKSNQNKDVNVTGETRSAPNLLSTAISSYYTNVYPGFPMPYRANKEEQKTKSTSINLSEDPPEDISLRGPSSKDSKFGRGDIKKSSSNSDKDPNEATSYDREAVMRDFKLLCQNIATRSRLQQNFIGDLEPTRYINFSHLEFSTVGVSKEVKNWCKRERKNREWQNPRHLALSEFQTQKNQFFYMIEIQRRTDLKESYPIIFFYDLEYKKIAPSTLLKTVEKIRNQMGKVKAKIYPLLNIRLIKHQSDASFVIRQIEKIMSESKLT